MSVRVMNRVWECSRAKGSGLLVLLAIADYANDRYAEKAWPGLDAIAQKARCTTRRAQQLLKELAEMGELEVDIQAGPRGCNVYRVKCFHHGRNDCTRKHFGVGEIQSPQISPTGGEIQSLQISPEPLGTISNDQEPLIPPTPLQGVESEEAMPVGEYDAEQEAPAGPGAEGKRGEGSTARREAQANARRMFVLKEQLVIVEAKLEMLAQRKKTTGELTDDERDEKRALGRRREEIEAEMMGME